MGDRHALAAYRDLGRMLRKVRKEAGLSETALFGGPFRLIEFQEHRPIVYLDHLQSGLILEDPRYVDSYYGLVPRIADIAL